MEGRRDHVLGQRFTQLVPQHVGMERPLAGVEGHQMLAVIALPGDHDCTLADARQPQECVLDLADLYPEATDLDLSISAAEKLQLALRQPATIVTTPVQPVALAVWIGLESSSRALEIVDVPAADTDAGEDDLPRRADRHQRQMLVDDVDVHVVDGTTKRNALALGHAAR